jgi:hypothetical protein
MISLVIILNLLVGVWMTLTLWKIRNLSHKNKYLWTLIFLIALSCLNNYFLIECQ